MSMAGIPIHNEPPPRHGEVDGHSHVSDHVIQFYVEDEAFLDSLCQSIGAALAAGDPRRHDATTASHLARVSAKRFKTSGFDTLKGD